MIGAGILVFPGLAAGRTGPAAALSFAIGAVIALLVALPTSELATAMSESGGGYYFISRGFGTLPGAVVGIELTFGLLFASAFYLVGLGEYAAAILVEANLVTTTTISPSPVNAVLLIGVVAGLSLTVLSVFGTENTESLQNAVVGFLLAILAVFLSVSGLDVFGVRARSVPPYRRSPTRKTAATFDRRGASAVRQTV